MVGKINGRKLEKLIVVKFNNPNQCAKETKKDRNTIVNWINNPDAIRYNELVEIYKTFGYETVFELITDITDIIKKGD